MISTTYQRKQVLLDKKKDRNQIFINTWKRKDLIYLWKFQKIIYVSHQVINIKGALTRSSSMYLNSISF